MRATESRNLEEEVARVPVTVGVVGNRMARLRRVADLPERPRVLDLGSASGVYVAALEQNGYECVGLEPAESALTSAGLLLRRFDLAVRVSGGVAECLPFRDCSFDIVHACSVVEHVVGLDKALHEIYRILRPGGVLWFSSTSAMCPVQPEIRGFPLFGWYPDALKLRIMEWARVKRPDLIGHTHFPAINWFTPRKARRILRAHGFTRVFDRWELRQPHEVAAHQRLILRAARTSKAARFVADVLKPGCSFAAVK